MNKRITSLLLCLVMVFTMLATAVPVFAVGADEVTVTPDKTTANPGDTITYTVTLGEVSLLGGFQIEFTIPTGLTYVPSSAQLGEKVKAPDGLKADTAHFNESLQLFANVGDIDGYTGNGAVLGTFKCTVDSNASGTLKIGTSKATFIDDFAEPKAVTVDLDSSAVTISAMPVEVTGVTLNKDSLELTAGQYETLTATIAPNDATNKAVSWVSSDPSIATVDDNGKVTAVAKGNATITVKSKENNGLFDVCHVMVNCAHTHTTSHAAVESTCLVEGNEAYTTCDDCGETVSGSNMKLPKADHAYGTLIAKVNATHTADGTAAHYQCSVCNKYFTEAKVETTLENLKIGATGHDSGLSWVTTDPDNHWKLCSCGDKLETAPHTWGWVIDIAATEDTTGIKHEQCTVCNAKRNENTVSEKLDHTHNLTHFDAVASTCTVQGTVDYYHCTKCNKNYKDETGNVELADISAPLAEHQYTVLQKDSDQHWYKCANCSATDTKVNHFGGTANCCDMAKCEVCDTAYGSTNPAVHKTPTSYTYETNNDGTHKVKYACCDAVKESAASCSGGSATCKDLAECQHCHTAYGDYAAHTGGTANCCDKAVCDVCHNEYGTTTPAVHKTPTTYKYETNNDGTHKVKYDCCDAVKASAENCSGGTATCTTKAECQHCHTAYGSKNPANHGDYGTHLFNYEEADCQHEGYSGDVICNGCDQKISDGTSISKKAHTTGDWISDANKHWKVCSECVNKVDEADHAWQPKVKTAATYTDKGVGYDECSVCGEITADYDIPIMDHSHDASTLDVISAKAPTCIAEGNNEYYHCTKCDQYYKDSTGSVLTSVEAEKLAMVAHTYEWKTVTPATKEAEGSAEEVCSVCNHKSGNTKVLEKLPADPIEYKMLEGATQIVEQGKEATFKSEAEFAKFVKVTVDGADVAAANYEVNEGSTVVTLKADYTKGLSVGEHTLTVVSNDGTATTTFTVKAATVPGSTDTPSSPQTGDSNNIFLWIALMFVAGTGLVGTTVVSKKKKAK